MSYRKTAQILSQSEVKLDIRHFTNKSYLLWDFPRGLCAIEPWPEHPRKAYSSILLTKIPPAGSVKRLAVGGVSSVYVFVLPKDELVAPAKSRLVHTPINGVPWLDSDGIIASWPQPPPKPSRILRSRYLHWQNSIELAARIILAQKTLANGLFTAVLPQYLASL